jgi:hypothetical protein
VKQPRFRGEILLFDPNQGEVAHLRSPFLIYKQLSYHKAWNDLFFKELFSNPARLKRSTMIRRVVRFSAEQT